MGKYINEELSYIKYLFDYKKGVVISEQETTTTSTTIAPQTNTVIPATTEPVKPSEKETDPKKIIETITNDICTQNNDKCRPCGEMLKNLEVGRLKESVIEKCLSCKSKTGKEYLECDKIKGQLLALSVKATTEKKTISGQASIWVMLGSSLLSLGKEIKSLFQKEREF